MTVETPSSLTAPSPEISTFLRARIEAGDFPSAVYLVAENGRPVSADALGDAVRQPQQALATLGTIYDLASLTKPLITGLLCARRVERGELSLDSAISEYLPEFDRPDKKNISLRQIVTHTSGLPAWRPLYILSPGARAQVLTAIANEPLQCPAGERVVYSDLGFIVLGFLLQKLTGNTLEMMAREEIFAPLQFEHTFFNPAAAFRTGVAACESGNLYEHDMCERDLPGQTFDGWRQDVIWGEVHDGNAYFLGGVAGHAGLFSNAQETLALADQSIGDQTRILAPETCAMFRQNMTPGLNEARSFAWQLAATEGSTAGEALPPDAFGHTGFTGTSCWVDASKQRVFILLTNRTHARPLPFVNINSVRREFHTLAIKALASQ